MALCFHAPTARPRGRFQLRPAGLQRQQPEQMRAIMEVADKCDAPVIVQASAGGANTLARPFCAT